MDKIRDRKSFEVGGHWPLWRGWKKRMTTQNRQKSNAEKREKTLRSTGDQGHLRYKYHWTILGSLTWILVWPQWFSFIYRPNCRWETVFFHFIGFSLRIKTINGSHVRIVLVFDIVLFLKDKRSIQLNTTYNIIRFSDFYWFFLAFDFCRFCVVIRFFHPRHNGQWPPTSKDFLSLILSITFIFLS